MVRLFLSKLIEFIHAVNECPLGVPKRSEKLSDAYDKLQKTSSSEVSIKVSSWLEKFNEINIDDYEKTEKQKILIQLIEMFSETKFEVPLSKSTKVYLVPPRSRCNQCPESDTLVLIRPGRKGVSSILYTKTGPRWVQSFHLNCPKCSAVFYANYWEHNGEREYYAEKSDIFSITTETFFTQDLLKELSEDLFICETRFVNFCTKYNRLYIQEGMPPIHRTRLQNCWQMFAIWMRIPLVFPVMRKVDRNLDIEKIMKHLYPNLRTVIDKKWLNHMCQKCSSRLCVLDGDAKAFRIVCSAKGEKIVTKGHLNEFTACIRTPMTGQQFCEHHLADKTGESEDRLDVRLTRSKRRELGLDIEKLTESGCRKTEDITVRKTRDRTAGMMFAYRTCGISLGHLESIHAETCTGNEISVLLELMKSNVL